MERNKKAKKAKLEGQTVAQHKAVMIEAEGSKRPGEKKRAGRKATPEYKKRRWKEPEDTQSAPGSADKK